MTLTDLYGMFNVVYVCSLCTSGELFAYALFDKSNLGQGIG